MSITSLQDVLVVKLYGARAKASYEYGANARSIVVKPPFPWHAKGSCVLVHPEVSKQVKRMNTSRFDFLSGLYVIVRMLGISLRPPCFFIHVFHLLIYTLPCFPHVIISFRSYYTFILHMLFRTARSNPLLWILQNLNKSRLSASLLWQVHVLPTGCRWQ